MRTAKRDSPRKHVMTEEVRGPEDVVADFIKQANVLFDKHGPKIKEWLDKRGQKDVPEKEREKFFEKFDKSVRKYREKHKSLCESFGIKITPSHFSETRFEWPCPYTGHEVKKVQKESPTKVKVFTKTPRKTYNTNMVFDLEWKKGVWIPTKLRYIIGKKEESTIW